MIITSDRVRNVTFGTNHQQSRLWNLQPDNIRESPSIQDLKYSLKSNISSKPFYYYTGSRLGQILHSRLRMQCSSLNQHLYRKNIVDSPNCICGLTGSTTHYLFHCLRYTAQRQMHIPIDLTTEILLFGSPKLAPNQNVVRDSLLKVFCLFSLFHCFFFPSCALLFHHLVLPSI